MWEGKEEHAAHPEPAEPEAEQEPATAPEENDFNDNDDEFGDDFDDFAEGEEADDDFGDFDDIDETPMAPEPQPQVQTKEPDFLAGLVSSVQSNLHLPAFVFTGADKCFTAVIELRHICRY